MNPQTVAVFGTADRQLPALVTALGARVVSLPLQDLATFQSGARSIDVAVVDLRDIARLPPDFPLFKRRHPNVPVILVLASLEPTLILEAMRSGVTECVTEPLTEATLGAAFERLTAQKAPQTQGELFAFLGAKGGVGTTTVAVNVATSLAQSGQRTLYIDLHVAYGDAAVFFGVEPRFSIIDALENIHRLDEALFKTLVVSTASGTDLLASSSQGLVWATDLQRVRRLLEFASRQYRYVVVDCPRSDATMLDALEPASKIVLVTNQEFATLRSASRMAAMLRQRYRADRIMVVVSRFDTNAEIGHDDVEKVVGSSVRHLVPSDYRASLEALNHGRPLVLKNHSRLAESMSTLARELGGLSQNKPAAASKGGGLLSRLTGKRA